MPPKYSPLTVAPREQQIVELLLQGCDNDDIAKQLKMARRTVKAYLTRLYEKYGVKGGIKRVKLATLIYRRRQCHNAEQNSLSNRDNTEQSSPSENIKSSSGLQPETKTKKSRRLSEPQNLLLRTTCAQSTTSLDSGIESSLLYGTRRGSSNLIEGRTH